MGTMERLERKEIEQDEAILRDRIDLIREEIEIKLVQVEDLKRKLDDNYRMLYEAKLNTEYTKTVHNRPKEIIEPNLNNAKENN